MSEQVDRFTSLVAELKQIFLQCYRGGMGEVIEERQRQDIKWGVQNHDPLLWFAILGEEVGEVSKALVEWRFDPATLSRLREVREELIQVAAVAVAMAESLSRNELAGVTISVSETEASGLVPVKE